MLNRAFASRKHFPPTQSFIHIRKQETYLKDKRLIEHRIQGLSMHFSFKLLFLIGKQVHFDVRVWSSTHVQSGQIFRLDDRHR